MERVLKAVGFTRSAQRILHQCAAARPDSQQREARRLPHLLPEIDDEEANQFPEHLADLGSGDEIASGTDWPTRRVVAVTRMAEAQAHIGRERHRSRRFDLRVDLLAKGKGFLLSHEDAPLRKRRARCLPRGWEGSAPCPW